MKWFDAMCEEPFDAVAKVVCILPHCGKKCYRPCEDFGHGEKVTFVRQLEFWSFCICCFDSQLHIHSCPFAARYFSVLVSSSGL